MTSILPCSITISRQMGSGGSYIGHKLAHEFSLFYADREVIFQAAKQLSLLTSDIESRDEKLASFWDSFFYTFSTLPNVFIPPRTTFITDSQLFEVQAQAVRRIAQEYSSVFIGRCAGNILRENPCNVNIFLHADLSFRTKRISELLGVSPDEAHDIILQSDDDRARYHLTFTGKAWSDASQYDFTLDTGKVGLDGSYALILNYFQTLHKKGFHDDEIISK